MVVPLELGVTVLVGIGYWKHIVRQTRTMPSPSEKTASAGRCIGSFFVIWTLAFVDRDGAADVARRGA